MAYDIAALKARLGTIRVEENPAILKQKSRDFYWYSPILKRQLDAVVADIMVSPQSESELLDVLAACHALDIPVTPRGTGTGNYGQAMPLSGGVLLDLSGMKAVKSVGNGRVTVEPGAVMAEIDHHTRKHHGQELRLHPSTYHTASVGGFIAGGSGGIGSIRWGGLRDYGNIIRLKVATMEGTPRIVELEGDDILRVAHAYGTNGIITECEVPLAPAYSWVDVLIGFENLMKAIEFATFLGEQDGLLLKELGLIAAPAPHDYFLRHRKFIPREKHVVAVMVADFALSPMLAYLKRFSDGEVLMRSDTLTESEAQGLPPVFELVWNHTTLRALRADPTITYQQVLYNGGPHEIAKLHNHYDPEELTCHLEFVRFDGRIRVFGLPLIRYKSDAQLDEIFAHHEDMNAVLFNAHRYTLEEGGMKQTDEAQLAFKRQADPKGLLNPGKMIAWEDPDFDFSANRQFLFAGRGGFDT